MKRLPAVGLDALVRDFALDGLSYYYRGLGDNVNERVGAGLIVGNSLLTARGIPTAGEGDLKTNVAMLLLECSAFPIAAGAVRRRPETGRGQRRAPPRTRR